MFLLLLPFKLEVKAPLGKMEVEIESFGGGGGGGGWGWDNVQSPLVQFQLLLSPTVYSPPNVPAIHSARMNIERS